MNIAEPGLFEWLAWYQDGMPDWMTGEELARAGYNIQLAYKPYISADELQEATESCQQFYIRNFFVTQCALQVNNQEFYIRHIFVFKKIHCGFFNKVLFPHLCLLKNKNSQSLMYRCTGITVLLITGTVGVYFLNCLKFLKDHFIRCMNIE